jgi:mono/diheme cytochrome c family protein
MRVRLNRRTVLTTLWIIGLGIGGFIVYAWRSVIPPIDPPAADSFTAQTIERGAQLAALGDCLTCHTAPGGEAFAGGRAVQTPFGAIYSTNISPDVTTGIGHWSQEAFQRALRDGVSRDGSHLYPAFPYDHFALLVDTDSAALYAFMMTRQPVQAKEFENQLPFPLNMRLVIAGWKLLFFRTGTYRPDSAQSEQWNRGAYLANGIGHCGACHTPRNDLGAEISSQHLAGGEAEGWRAYALGGGAAGRADWTAEELYTYLRQGWHAQHGIAFGPMQPVVRNLGVVADSDVRAISTYVASLMTRRIAQKPDTSGNELPSNEAGAAIFANACAGCHDGTQSLPHGGIKLTLSSAVISRTATNLVRIMLEGLQPPQGDAGAIMPGFASALTDGQLESLAAYIRSNIGGRQPWGDLEATVREARSHAGD